MATAVAHQVYIGVGSNVGKGQVVYSARPDELWANDAIKSRYLGL